MIVKHKSRCILPNLHDLRRCLLQLSDDIVSTVNSIDNLSPNPLLLPNPDDTMDINTPTDWELEEVTELARLNNECERILVEKQR